LEVAACIQDLLRLGGEEFGAEKEGEATSTEKVVEFFTSLA
jgi:hypothetical protein